MKPSVSDDITAPPPWESLSRFVGRDGGRLRLFRLPNLLIVFVTQWIAYWLVLRPSILRAGAIPVLTPRTFGWVAAATVLTTLGGYLINDWFDRDIDRINRPGR